jgi:two-component system, LuxR family, response regulator FixJ
MQPTPAKVFIVDDDDAVRDSLKMLLESYGMEVEDYASVGAFKRQYRAAPGQCLILDQHLPNISGLDFLASSNGTMRELSVILLTGRGDASIRDRAFALGVLDYLEKPVSDEVLLAAIAKAVGRS